jgi:hypothetical protein
MNTEVGPIHSEAFGFYRKVNGLQEYVTRGLSL